jgi:hypothetical protein
MSIKGTKTVGLVDVKAGPDAGLPEGRVSAMVAVYGNKDSDGDIVDVGEVDGFIADFKAGKVGTVPHVDHHQHGNPHAYTGEVVDLDGRATAVLEDGTKIEGVRAEIQFELDQPDNEAAQAYARKNYDNIRTGKVKQWSYYWEAEGREKLKDGFHLRGMRFNEVASVLKGANGLSRTLAVKAEKDAAEGRKAYVDIDVPGSFEAIQDVVGDALRDRFGNQDNSMSGPWVSLVATLPDRACYQVLDANDTEQDDPLYWIDYTIEDDGSVTLGDPTPATASISDGAAKSATKTASPLMDAELLHLAQDAIAV